MRNNERLTLTDYFIAAIEVLTVYWAIYGLYRYFQ